MTSTELGDCGVHIVLHVISLQCKQPSSVTIDFPRDRLIWVDSWLGTVSWLPLGDDGAEPKQIHR